MPGRRATIIQWVSLLAGLVIVLQITFILTRGEAFCLNEGCRVAEKLTVIPPLFINLAGLLYFLVLFGIGRLSLSGSYNSLGLLSLLLLLGLAVEGVLLSYQLFVIRTFCSYCLVIFFFVVVLNLIRGWQQIRIAIPLFAAILASFAALNFNPASVLALRNETFASGTYAVKKCAEPTKKLYFFFSSNCPHCKNVLSVLENCNICEFSFNPVDENQVLTMPGIEYTRSYSPTLNRAILSMLAIDTIPVLLEQNRDGLTFIRGEDSIIRYVNRECSLRKQDVSEEPSPDAGREGMNFLEEQEGECAIEVECPDESDQQLTPYGQ